KLCFVDFVGGFLEFVPLFSAICGSRGRISPLAGEKAKSRNWPDQGQTSDFARGGLGEVSANGTVPLSRKI
ncbi:MAG: hypothetical protein QUV71_07035, partial [Rhizobium sp.]|nr:hypothetical protein [Rhizobium sp.]